MWLHLGGGGGGGGEGGRGGGGLGTLPVHSLKSSLAMKRCLRGGAGELPLHFHLCGVEVLSSRGAVAEGIGVDGLFIQRLRRSSEGRVEVFRLRCGNRVTGLPEGLHCAERDVWPNADDVDIVRGTIDGINGHLLGEVVRCVVAISEDRQ